MSLKHNKPFNTLTGSVRAIWRSDAVLRATYKGPQALNRRLASGKFCFSKAKKRTDTCELCDGWDHHVPKSIENTIAKFESEMESLAPSYWKVIDFLFIFGSIYVIPPSPPPLYSTSW